MRTIVRHFDKDGFTFIAVGAYGDDTFGNLFRLDGLYRIFQQVDKHLRDKVLVSL